MAKQHMDEAMKAEHPDHHHKAIKHHMSELHKMAKHGHKHHEKAAPKKSPHSKKK